MNRILSILHYESLRYRKLRCTPTTTIGLNTSGKNKPIIPQVMPITPSFTLNIFPNR